ASTRSATAHSWPKVSARPARYSSGGSTPPWGQASYSETLDEEREAPGLATWYSMASFHWVQSIAQRHARRGRTPNRRLISAAVWASEYPAVRSWARRC